MNTDHALIAACDCEPDLATALDELKKRTAERDALRVALRVAYDAACHFMVCRECAEAEPCVRGQEFTEKLAKVCDPIL